MMRARNPHFYFAPHLDVSDGGHCPDEWNPFVRRHLGLQLEWPMTELPLHEVQPR